MLIKRLLTVHTGIYVKKGIIGDVIYLQGRHFDKYGVFSYSVSPELRLTEKIKKHILKQDDVLFSAKGINNFSVVYDDSVGIAVASTAFFVLRIKDFTYVDPHYLCWFLNHPKTKSYFHVHAKGTSIPSIKKETLENLEVIIPSMKYQKNIVRINKMLMKEIQFRKKTGEIRESIVQQRLWNALYENLTS